MTGAHYSSSDALSDVAGAGYVTGPHLTGAGAIAAVATAGYVAGSHYDDSDALAIMGVEDDLNAYNHSRYSDTDAVAACQAAGFPVGAHYDDTDAPDGNDVVEFVQEQPPVLELKPPGFNHGIP